MKMLISMITLSHMYMNMFTEHTLTDYLYRMVQIADILKSTMSAALYLKQGFKEMI